MKTIQLTEKEEKLLLSLICKEQLWLLDTHKHFYNSEAYRRLEALKTKIQLGRSEAF